VSQLRITTELDNENGVLLVYDSTWPAGTEQVIYLDGRPHPSANALTNGLDFSTGTGTHTLVYTTAHLKEAYLTRTGVPKSAKANSDDASPSIRKMSDLHLHH